MQIFYMFLWKTYFLLFLFSDSQFFTFTFSNVTQGKRFQQIWKLNFFDRSIERENEIVMMMKWLFLSMLVATSLINVGNGEEFRESRLCNGTATDDHLSCKQVDVLFEYPRTVEEANYPLTTQKLVLIFIALSTIFALTSLFFNWYSAYTVLFTVSLTLYFTLLYNVGSAVSVYLRPG